ncbi:MAG TPA: hypothetical protein VGR37_08415, partial [Longimicrobiaceae bacterium]|nr:hypothetical protein [Longimicrobiaceae bacterium]
MTSIGTDAPNRGNTPRGPGRESLRRRAEDRVLPLLLAPQPGQDARLLPAGGSGSRLLQGYEVGPEPSVRVTECEDPPLEADDGAVLVELGTGDALLAAGAAIRRIPRGAGGEDLLM